MQFLMLLVESVSVVKKGLGDQRTRFRLRQLLLSFVAFVFSAHTAAAVPNMFLNQTEIDAIKLKIDAGEAPWTDAYNTVISRANAALTQGLESVTYQGPRVGSTSLNWYYSTRDAPLSHSRGDYFAAIRLGDKARDLGLAYAFTGDAKYADRVIELIDTWSINPDTRMNVSAGNRIERYITIPGYFYGADLISDYDGWSSTERTGFQSWVKGIGDYTQSNGEGNNNFSNWRVVMLASAGAVLDESLTTESSSYLSLAESEWKRLIPIQMNGSGSSKPGILGQEVGRDDGLHYSLFALNAMIQGAEILRQQGVNVYDYVDPNTGGSLKLALDFITPYALDPTLWGTDSATSGRTQLQTITADNSMALFELAYSYYQDPDYLAVLERWGRPIDEIRTLGIATLTHGNTFDLDIASVANGDFDFDSNTDGADFLQWQRSGLSASSLDAWEANFGTGDLPAAASTSVPEPSTGLMLVVCCGICAMRRRRAAV